MDFKDRLEFALLESNEKRCIIVNVYEPDAPGERVAGIWQLIPFSSLDSAYNWVREQDPEQDFGIEDNTSHKKANRLARWLWSNPIRKLKRKYKVYQKWFIDKRS